MNLHHVQVCHFGISLPTLYRAHSAFSQVVILALANPKIWMLSTGQAWNNFIQIEKLNFIRLSQPNLNFIPLSQPKLNFIPLSQPKLNFILLSGKSGVGQCISKGFPLTLHGIKASLRYHFIFSCVTESGPPIWDCGGFKSQFWSEQTRVI